MQSSYEKVNNIFNRNSNGEGAMWTGHLSDGAIKIFSGEWGLEPDNEKIYTFLNDDCRWINVDDAYKAPDGKPAFDPSQGKSFALSSKTGLFATIEKTSEIEKFDWPDPAFIDFSDIHSKIEKHSGKMILTGFWSPFFHIVADYLGMENYFAKMYDNPAVIDAVTEKIVDFYVKANEMFYENFGDMVSTMFFGNDFGTQLDLILSPDCFRRFVLPSLKRIIDVGKKYGKTVILHSCGSIYRVIPDLIEAGVDVLHPIQAQAYGMDAKSLSQYKNELAFIGGIDAQSFFVQSTPSEIKDEVNRVRDILGPNIVISPSHEEILPNVPAANILAMAEAAKCK